MSTLNDLNNKFTNVAIQQIKDFVETKLPTTSLICKIFMRFEYSNSDDIQIYSTDLFNLGISQIKNVIETKVPTDVLIHKIVMDIECFEFGNIRTYFKEVSQYKDVIDDFKMNSRKRKVMGEYGVEFEKIEGEEKIMNDAINCTMEIVDLESRKELDILVECTGMKTAKAILLEHGKMKRSLSPANDETPSAIHTKHDPEDSMEGSQHVIDKDVKDFPNHPTQAEDITSMIEIQPPIPTTFSDSISITESEKLESVRSLKEQLHYELLQFILLVIDDEKNNNLKNNLINEKLVPTHAISDFLEILVSEKKSTSVRSLMSKCRKFVDDLPLTMPKRLIMTGLNAYEYKYHDKFLAAIDKCEKLKMAMGTALNLSVNARTKEYLDVLIPIRTELVRDLNQVVINIFSAEKKYNNKNKLPSHALNEVELMDEFLQILFSESKSTTVGPLIQKCVDFVDNLPLNQSVFNDISLINLYGYVYNKRFVDAIDKCNKLHSEEESQNDKGVPINKVL